MNIVKIGKKRVGEGQPCLIMMDAGVNHNNIPERAFQLIRTAAEAGADVIKFQTYKAEKLATRTAPRYWNSKLDTDKGGSQYDTFKKIDSLPMETYYEMKKLCDKLGIIFSSTPFDLDSADFLEGLGMEVFKIASADIIHMQLIRKVARTGKPVILSTGLASLKEIKEAVDIIKKEGNDKIILQHCILSYPCEYKDVNLEKMRKIQETFLDIPVGYSDHTYGDIAPVTAVAMGARSIEKHYTIDKSLPDSPDHSFSLDPAELKEMVKKIRQAEECKGKFIDGYYPSEEKAYLYARKSIVAKVDISKGTKITEDMLICKRPGTGIYPKFMDDMAGMVAKRDIKEDEMIEWSMLVDGNKKNKKRA